MKSIEFSEQWGWHCQLEYHVTYLPIPPLWIFTEQRPKLHTVYAGKKKSEPRTHNRNPKFGNTTAQLQMASYLRR